MIRTANLLGLALMLAPPAAFEPLKVVVVVVAPKPYFVGQGVEVRVEVDPASGPATVEAPQIPGADIFPMSADPARPSAGRFVVVPGHAGKLELPSFRARSGDRSGASRPTQLAVSNVPSEGRTSAFLGGVGPFEVGAEVDPPSVNVGQTLEFRVRISGSAASGSVRTPDLNGWSTPTLAVTALEDRLVAEGTPSRTFRYRVRPLKSGRIVLPPVAVAAFDPASRRYLTKATSGITVRVEEPPRFDPDRLDYAPAAMTSRASRPKRIGLVLGTMVVALGSALAAWIVARRRRRLRRPDPRRLALELGRGLGAEDNEIEAARAIVEALTTFLQRADGRSPGVLTPPEARSGFGRLTGDPGLESFAESLVARCDRARYGSSGGEAMGMIAEGRRFFEGVAGAMANGKGIRSEGGPGEAVETASTS